MSKRKSGAFSRKELIDNSLSKFKHIDLQRACIVRRLPFENIGESYYFLASYFDDHYEDSEDIKLLDEFDKWREESLRARGDDSPLFIKLGFIERTDEETGEILKRKRPKFLKKKKIRRERNEALGIFSGTKKEATFLSQQEGKTLEETIIIVIDKFPEAKEKSIRIWWKKAAKLNVSSKR